MYPLILNNQIEN